MVSELGKSISPTRAGWPPPAGAVLAAVTAIIGWTALAIEFHRSVSSSLHRGVSLAESLFLYFRYFSILTNVGIAVLMTVTAIRLTARRSAPPARVFNAALVYIGVTCVTYEVMLRSQWTPRGLQFLTDTMIHDVVPALTLVFWLGFAPRSGTRWSDPLWVLCYPAAYLIATLGAGAYGEGYPYSFLDASKLGLPGVLAVAGVFLAVFSVLSFLTVRLSRAWARHS